MEVVKTLAYKIKNHSKIFDKTIEIYNEALSFIIYVIDQEFDSIGHLSTKSLVPAVESFIHFTKTNTNPKYKNFDSLFYKYPSYLRRSTIAQAFGIVKSYRSNLQNWENEKEIAFSQGLLFKKKAPSLQLKHNAFPVFYKDNMFERTSDSTALIKVFHQNDWVWIEIEFKKQDLYKRGVWNWKENNPTLVKVGKKYFLHISYESKVKLKKDKIQNIRACNVDLGLTKSAVCSIMDSNGTVLARKFINQSKEKDRFATMINKLKKAQHESGKGPKPNFWRRINGLQDQIVNDTAHQIVKFANKHGAHVIVFEYLGKMKMPKGIWGARRLRHKLQFWAKMRIQKKVEQMAHYLGMRFSRVNAKNTSALAFDGSGEIVRSDRKDLCTFTTGKKYHADLNASYNIGARYFIREIQKSTSEKKWLFLQAKAPELAKRTQLTLSSLISLQQAQESVSKVPQLV
ncbi:transposase [Paenibacillus sp. N4]|uniref:RNA-guided endonuclease TnpB family protein n=1 Tax=Paenibacillus vietnamensis TaxID=2590547 RepID=UPI001CD06BA7|nr:RNA-guided endonuclease TnpB family protein [Paenibacillus vietnamensis]MCA0757165.1 transposase [Paenibacillus vietnamensis]